MMMFQKGLSYFHRAVTLLKRTSDLNSPGVMDGWSESLRWERCCGIWGRKNQMAQQEASVEKANQGSQKGQF